MDYDPSLFGHGRYPDSGPLAVIARLAFLLAVLSIVGAAFLPPDLTPQFAKSHYLEHFAAFYVALLSALAAMPRAQLRGLGVGFVAFATMLEGAHFAAGAAFRPLLDNWVADLGGLTAAAAPVVIERFRRRFRTVAPPPEPL